MIDDDDAIGQLVRLLQVLGGEQQGHSLGHQFPDDVPHAQPAGGVQPGGRLVEEEHGGPGNQAGGQVQAAPHAAGISLHDSIGGVRELEAGQQLLGPGLGAGPAQAAELTDHHQVLPAGEQLVQGGILGGDPYLATDGARLGDHVMAGHPGPALVGDGQGGQDPHGGRLARTVRPEHPEDRPGVDRKIHPGQGLGGTVSFLQAFGLDHGV